MDRSDLQLIPVPAEIGVTDGRKQHGLPLQPKINEVSNGPTIHADRFMMMDLPASNGCDIYEEDDHKKSTYYDVERVMFVDVFGFCCRMVGT